MKAIAFALLCTGAIVALDARWALGQSNQPSARAFVTHTDPSGFVVNIPIAWTVAKDAATGQIGIRGTRGEQITIWPLSLQKVQLDARGGAALVRQLARKFDPGIPWNPAPPKPNVARLQSESGGRGASALLSWTNTPSGASAYFYGVEAPLDVYRASTDSFVTVLKSFHVVQDASLKGGSGAGVDTAGPLTFVSWSDPHEGAFTTSVPRGWRVVGGAYRLSATDVRYLVATSSPDGQVHTAIGDATLGAFIQPSPMLAMAGLREGMNYRLGDGSLLNIRRYMNGTQFARGYVELVLSRTCSGPQINSNNPRPDFETAFEKDARAEGFAVPVSAGDVTFTCNLNGHPVQGKYVAGTIQVSGSGIWFAYRLFGYLSAAGREPEGEKVLTQAVQNWKFNPQWLAQQRNTANAAVLQDTVRSQELRQRAMQAIADDQRQTSDMIMKGWEERSKVYDEIDRRRENAILGTLDVIDPETGQRYKVSDYGDYHYMDNSGYIWSTNVEGAPSPDMHEMITLP